MVFYDWILFSGLLCLALAAAGFFVRWKDAGGGGAEVEAISRGLVVVVVSEESGRRRRMLCRTDVPVRSVSQCLLVGTNSPSPASLGPRILVLVRDHSQ